MTSAKEQQAYQTGFQDSASNPLPQDSLRQLQQAVEPLTGMLEAASIIREVLVVFRDLAQLEKELEGTNIHEMLENLTKIIGEPPAQTSEQEERA